MEPLQWISIYRIWVNYPDTLVKILRKTTDVGLIRLYRTCHFMRHFIDEHSLKIGRNIFCTSFFFDMDRIKYRRLLTSHPNMNGRDTWIPKNGFAQQTSVSGTYRLMFQNLTPLVLSSEEVGGFGPDFVLRNMTWRIGFNIRTDPQDNRILAVFLQCQIDLPELSIDCDASFTIVSQNPKKGDFVGKFVHNYSKDNDTFGFEEFITLDKLFINELAHDQCLLIELKMRAGVVQNVLTPMEYQARIEELIQKANNIFVNNKDVTLAIKHIKQVLRYCADRDPGEFTRGQIEWHLQTFRDYQREMMTRPVKTEEKMQ